MSSEFDLHAELSKLVAAFRNRALEELTLRISRWNIDLEKREVHEVVGALLARQVTIAIELVSAPSMWNGHVAPILLRAMADVFISLTWILRDPTPRARQFILFGLGQVKLQLERRRAEVEGREPTPQEKQLIEVSEQWIDSQRYSFLTEVNLGSWSGLNTRQMAQEADCIDFYNYVYTPFSSCTHSTWDHVARYNLSPCANPLHQYHRRPVSRALGGDPVYPHLAARYLRKALKEFDRATGIHVEEPTSLTVFENALDSFGS